MKRLRMDISRRTFLGMGLGTGLCAGLCTGTVLGAGLASKAQGALGPRMVSAFATEDVPPRSTALPPAFDKLRPIAGRAHAITSEEFRARLEHAQRLMAEIEADPGMAAIFVTPGT